MTVVMTNQGVLAPVYLLSQTPSFFAIADLLNLCVDANAAQVIKC